jgi:chromosome segregation ATPase
VAWDWHNLASALGGAASLKTAELAVQWWKGRADHSLAESTAQQTAAASLREELRSDVNRLLRRIEGLETDVDQWRRSYWQVVEEREALKLANRQLTLTVGSLTEELDKVKRRAGHLEREVKALQQQLGRTSGGEDCETTDVTVG